MQAPTAPPRALWDEPLAAVAARWQTERGLRSGQVSAGLKALSQALWRDRQPWEAAIDNAPRAVRDALHADGVTAALPPLSLREAVVADDQTTRMLWQTHDAQLVETVIIPSEGGAAAGRTTVCVSSQVGCGRGCTFCETGRLGIVRNLTPGEITGQLWYAVGRWERARADGEHRAPPITNVVFMGMGEPLDNLEHVLTAIGLMTHDWLAGLSARRITVSTVGVARRIPDFVQRTRAHLALSLNAPDDERRARIMPVGRRDNLDTLKATLQSALADAPGGPRDVLVEYVLFDGFNDALADADLLCGWLDGLPTRLNLIPANPGPDPALNTPADDRVRAFQRHLLDHGVRAMVRWPHGRGVGGACGQLAGGARGARI